MMINTITRGKAMLHNILALLFLSACAPEPTPPPVDVVGTFAAQLAFEMLTQTAAAYSPTPPPSTATPAYTSTPTIEPTPEVTKRPEVVGFAPCYQGPGATYPLVSNITETKKVELIGIGSVPGWYVIKNPYFNSPCWISAENLKIFSDHDLSGFPTITP
jgi:hypothetical protein